MAPKRQRRPHPGDVPVHPEEVAAVNRAFYGSDPADYFERRLFHLLSAAGRTDHELRAEPRTLTYGKLKAVIEGIAERPEAEDDHKRYVVIEAHMLLHHVAETLIRLHVAHSRKNRAPWIAVTQLRGPGALAKRAAALADLSRTPRLREEVAWNFIGTADPQTDAEGNSLAPVAQVLTDYLRYFASVLLDGAEIYNSAKHGLAVKAGESAMKLDGVPGFEASGPAFSHLATRRNDDGTWELVVRTVWVSPERDLALAWIALQMLETMWDIAKTRYCGLTMPADGLKIYRPPPVEDVLRGSRGSDSSVSIASVDMPPSMHAPRGSHADARRS